MVPVRFIMPATFQAKSRPNKFASHPSAVTTPMLVQCVYVCVVVFICSALPSGFFYRSISFVTFRLIVSGEAISFCIALSCDCAYFLVASSAWFACLLCVCVCAIFHAQEKNFCWVDPYLPSTLYRRTKAKRTNYLTLRAVEIHQPLSSPSTSFLP